FFRDYDKLRSSSIPRHEFIRGVHALGARLEGEELEVLADGYLDGERAGLCRWKDFQVDVDKVFAEGHLENQPRVMNENGLNEDPFVVESALTLKERRILRRILENIREHLRLRQISIKPFLKDFDKHYSGFVTKTQFRQCLTYMKCLVTDEEFDVLCKNWLKPDSHDRVCYMKFLEELEHGEGLSPYRNGGARAEELGSPRSVVEGTPKNFTVRSTLSPHHVKLLQNRIKTKVKIERIRLLDSMQDFDRLRHGKITKNEFRRSLRLIFELTENELSTLESLYQAQGEPNMVDYVKFNDEIERVFTEKELEKSPLKEPEGFTEFVRENGVEPFMNVLSPEETKVLGHVIARLSGIVRRHHIDILSYLEDYDYWKEGTITTNQLRSCLATHKMPVDERELQVIAHRFAVDKAFERVEYRAFAGSLMQNVDLDGRQWTLPKRKNVEAFSLW
ncbi:hypothetical protein HK102_013287, partial [Quaeritorhiza haematococci]